MCEYNNVPKIRFKGFTDVWEQRKLGDLMDITSVKRIHQSDWTESGIRFLRARDIVADYKKEEVEDKLYISKEKYEEYSLISGKVQIGDLLVTGVGTIGIPYLIRNNEPIYFKDGNIIWFKNNNKIDDNFLYYSFVGSKIQNFINEKSGVGTVGTYTIQSGKETPIMLTNNNEQRKISNLMSNLDNLITLHQRKCDTLVNAKKSLLEKMFPKNSSNIPEIRFKEFTDVWEQRKLTSFVEFYNGQTYSPLNVQDKGTLVLRSSNVQNGEISKDDLVFIDSDVVNTNNVEIGDIIVVVRNGSRNLIGKHAQIKEKMTDTVIGAFMTGIRSKNSKFVNSLLNTRIFNDEINKNMGATINQITGYMFSNMEFKIPTNGEQSKIGELFTNLDNLITLHQRKLEKLKNIKKSMLDKMFV